MIGSERSRSIARSVPADIQHVLDELDAIARQVRALAEAAPETTDPSTEGPAAERTGATWSEEPVEDPPRSPYLDERIELALSSLASLQANLTGLAGTWEELEEAVEVLESELGNAARELDFLRSEGAVATAEPVGEPAEPDLSPIARAVPAPARRTSRGPAYAGYTIQKYNATVGALKGRRTHLLGWTVVLAALISLILVAIQVLAREPWPSIWLAALPLIWMIPVPFFFLSFFGTQRVLRRNHLDIAEGL